MDTYDWLIGAVVLVNCVATFLTIRKLRTSAAEGESTDHLLLLILDLAVGAAFLVAVFADITWLGWAAAVASYLMYRHVRSVVEGTLFGPEADRR